MPPVLVYGTPAEVAALASMWSRNGIWVDPVPATEEAPADKGTNPTLAQVTEWLENVSAQLNLALGQANFIVPFDSDISPNAYKAMGQYVSSLVADLAHFKNSSGRFFTDRMVERGTTPMQAILKDMVTWISMNERGLLADGLIQRITPVPRNQLVFRTTGQFPRKYRRLP